jgi:quinolinate synthase
MRKLFPLLAVFGMFVGVAIAAEEKSVTITGDGVCAKCALKETATCQNAIKVEEDGKTVTYYLAANAVSKAYHKNVCTTTTKTKAVGTVKVEDGKKVLTATEIKKVD